MKQKLTLFLLALLAAVSIKAETSTWESREGWTAATGGVANLQWFGVHTPGDAIQTYSFTSIQLMQTSGSDNTNYLAIARVGSTPTLNADQVVAVSDNAIQATTDDKLETYNFSASVTLLGGTTYYLVFVTSNTPASNGTYTVQAGRLRLNHTGYGNYPYGNSVGNNGATWWPYFKATVESSPATNLSTGDVLGGSMSGSNWVSTWTSGTTPSFTLTSSAKNINNASSKPEGGLDIRSGSATSATYTITAPTGYFVAGYKLFGKALEGNQTVTPADDASAVVFTSAGNSISVTTQRRKAASSFTLTGENKGLFLHAIEVTLVPIASITTLPTDNNKAYVVTNARGTWNFADNATSMTAVVAANTNLDDQAQQVALIYKNDNYYLFSVNAGKYLTADNTLTSMPTEAEQVSITDTGNASYPWFFRFKNSTDDNGKYTKNINVSGSSTVAIMIDGWGPGGSNSNGTLDDGNRNAIIEAVDFDATNALGMFDVRGVTYKLSYGGNNTFRTESNVQVTLSAPAADFVPASFLNDFVTLSYSPETISNETKEVTVTATWNGPFQLSDNFTSAKWQMVHMHTYNAGTANYMAEKWTWTYRSDDSDKVKPEQALDYSAVTTNRLFCFVGNPYDGFKIYNAAAGENYNLARTDESGELTMAQGENVFTLHKSTSNTNTATYFCLKPSGATNFLNFDYANTKIAGWSTADNGSTCWVEAPGQYYLDFIDGLYLDAPVGAVGTRSYFATVTNPTTEKETLTNLRSTVASSMYSAELNTEDRYLDPIKNTEVIAIADGYYRIVNAQPKFAQDMALYFNSTSGKIVWARKKASKAVVDNLFRFTAADSKWSLYSPNAEKYLTANDGTLSEEASSSATLTNLGSAQWNINLAASGSPMHPAGHNTGNATPGTSGTLTSWAGGVGEPSAWYIVKADDVDLTLNGPVDGKYYATLFLPFDATLSESVEAYTLKLNDAQTALTMTEVQNREVPAGTPVLLQGTSQHATAAINAGDAFNEGSALDCDLTGKYVDTAVNGATDYFFGLLEGKVGFYHWSGTTMKANRAYLEATKLGGSGVKGLILDFEDDATAILTVSDRQATSEAIYNVAGQRLQKVQKGINIINGKKILK